MLSFSIVKEAFIEKARKVLKVEQFGAKTADVVSSFGDDSSPLKNMIAIYGNTSEVGDNIIIGYINKNQIATAGEKRIFSLKPDGSLSIDIHLRTDGTLEIAGANDFAVRYNALNNALQQEVVKINTELSKISTAMAAVGGTYIVAPVSLDISASKISEVKVK